MSAGMLSLMRKAELLMSFDEGRRKSYIVTTMRRTAISMLSRESLRRSKEERSFYLYADTACEPPDRALSERDAKDTLEITLDAIERLPEKQKACIKLKYLLNKSDRQIALETGLSETSIRKYISRARQRICKELETNEKEEV